MAAGASCTTSLSLTNHFKERLLSQKNRGNPRKADAKVGLFFPSAKKIRKKMREKLLFFAFLDIGQGCQSEELTKQGGNDQNYRRTVALRILTSSFGLSASSVSTR